MCLLGEMLGGGGLAVECVGAEGTGHARLILQLGGNVILRCTGVTGSLADAVAEMMAEVTERIGVAFATLAAVRVLAHATVFAATMVVAVTLPAAARTSWAEVLRPLIVFGVYAAFVPLRGRIIRVLLNRWLRVLVKSRS